MARAAPAVSQNESYVRRQPTEAESLEQLENFIWRLVAAGYETPEEIMQAAEDYLADDLDPRQIQLASGPMLQRALAAHAEDEAS